MKKVITINDLKKLAQNPEGLTPQQRLALKNFERHRINKLSTIKKEEKFQLEFSRFQSMANLLSYEEFLKEEYL